jgi:hypothetical protein
MEFWKTEVENEHIKVSSGCEVRHLMTSEKIIKTSHPHKDIGDDSNGICSNDDCSLPVRQYLGKLRLMTTYINGHAEMVTPEEVIRVFRGTDLISMLDII